MSFLQTMTSPTTGPAIYRLAEVMAGSQLIPPHLRGKIDDVFVALAMADQLGENPVVVMQNIYIVSGRAGWSASYMIARANRSGVFKGRISWRVTGKGPTLSVTALATLADTGEVVEMTADMEMARAEGWVKNSKYQSMPEVMLRYRSATLLIRMYAGDVMLGMHTDAELETMPVSEAVEVIQSPVTRPTGRAALGIGAPAQTVAMPDPVAERVVVEVSEPTLTPLQAKAAAAVEAAKLTPEDIANATGGKPAHEWDTAALKALSAIVQAKKAPPTPTDSDEVPL